MSVASPKQKKGWRRAPPTLLLLPALPKHSITDAVLQLHQVFPTVQVFQPTDTQRKCSQAKSLLADCLWAPGCCESQSWGPASLTPCLRDPALLLGQHSEPAQPTSTSSCFSQEDPLSSPALGSPWLLKHTGRGTVVPCLSSAQHRHSPAALLPAPLQSPLPARLTVTSVQQYPTDDAAEV